jgi:hypothetical protein
MPSAPASSSPAQGPSGPFSSESLTREPSRFALAVTRVENCVANMNRIGEQMASLAEQRRKLQDELRGIQCQINEEFERILKPSRPNPAKVVSRSVAGSDNGSSSAPCSSPLRMESRLPELEPVDEQTLARAAS